MLLKNVDKKLSELGYWSNSSRLQENFVLVAKHDDFRDIEIHVEGDKVVKFVVVKGYQNQNSKQLAKALANSAKGR